MKIGKYKNYTHCRISGSRNLVPFLKFTSALAGGFLPDRDAAQLEQQYPLTLSFCPDSGLVQVNEVIDKDTLFRNYFYKTGVVKTLVSHFESMALEYSKSSFSSVLEIGCNDFSMLKNLVGTRIKTIVGVDPSDVAAKHKVDGTHYFNDFFTYSLSERLKSKFGTMNIISASNCFAHIEDIEDVTKGIKNLLSEDGMAVIEVHWLGNLIKNMQFPFIYHEHMYYYSLKSMRCLLNAHGLDVYDVKPIDIHGGSIRFYCCHTGKMEPTEDTRKLEAEEIELGLYDASTFMDYSTRIEKVAHTFRVLIENLKSSGAKIYGYGASGQATTLMAVFGITEKDISVIIDDSPLKIGRLTPNNHIEIVSSRIIESAPPDYILCLAYTFVKEIMEKNQGFKGKWMVPLPDARIL